MIISRRTLFKSIAAAATIASMTGNAVAALLGDPRKVAWQLLDESTVIFKAQGKGPAYFNKTNELFIHLARHFPPTEPPSMKKMIHECSVLFRWPQNHPDHPANKWETCYDSTFAIMIIREGLKNRNLPMIQASMWKPFARIYSGIVLAA